MSTLPQSRDTSNPTSAASPMTARERNDLCTLIRRNEKLAKAKATQRGEELRADFEAKLAAIFAFDSDPVWKALNEEAARLDAERDAKIQARGDELGIPRTFQPCRTSSWSSRGENATASRRAELRHVATSRIAALVKAAHVKIEQQSVTAQTEIIATGLVSAEARAFLDCMPELIETAMPVLAVDPDEALSPPTRPTGYPYHWLGSDT